MKKHTLDFSKCKTELGTVLQYDLMLLSERDKPVVSIFFNRDGGLSKAQKKKLLKKLRETLDSFVHKCKSEDRERTVETTRHISWYDDENYKPFDDTEYEREYFDT